MNRIYLALIICLGFTCQALASTENLMVNVAEVKAALSQNKKATWTPKESWVSRLTTEDAKRMLGVKELPTGTLDFESSGKTSALAPLVDWRNQNGVNWLGPVMNQGNCGSCVAFASVATLEAQTSISTGLNWLHPSFSPQALFACGGGLCERGWMPQSAARYLEANGIPDEACMPYSSGSTGDDVSCSNKCHDAASRSLKISKSSTPSSGIFSSIDKVKAALAKGPLVTTLTVYADFMTYGSGVYQHVAGAALGGHAISIVGYDDAKRAWLIRNSWGKEWGEKGFAWVSFDDKSGVGSSTWSFDVANSKNYVSVTSPMDRAYISGNAKFSSEVVGASDATTEFTLTNDQGKGTTINCTAAANSKTCDATIDSTKLAEGHYQVTAKSLSSKVQSQAREFFVINSEPKLALSFTAAPGTDLTKPQNGRPEFLIKAESGSVPFQHIEFRVIDANGKIVATKGNDYVLPNMKMGWRTMTAPNGKYKILFHGELSYLGKLYSADSEPVEIIVQN